MLINVLTQPCHDWPRRKWAGAVPAGPRDFLFFSFSLASWWAKEAAQTTKRKLSVRSASVSSISDAVESQELVEFLLFLQTYLFHFF